MQYCTVLGRAACWHAPRCRPYCRASRRSGSPSSRPSPAHRSGAWCRPRQQRSPPWATRRFRRRRVGHQRMSVCRHRSGGQNHNFAHRPGCRHSAVPAGSSRPARGRADPAAGTSSCRYRHTACPASSEYIAWFCWNLHHLPLAGQPALRDTAEWKQADFAKVWLGHCLPFSSVLPKRELHILVQVYPGGFRCVVL